MGRSGAPRTSTTSSRGPAVDSLLRSSRLLVSARRKPRPSVSPWTTGESTSPWSPSRRTPASQGVQEQAHPLPTQRQEAKEGRGHRGRDQQGHPARRKGHASQACREETEGYGDHGRHEELQGVQHHPSSSRLPAPARYQSQEGGRGGGRRL